MASDIARVAALYKWWDWIVAHKPQVALAAGVLVGLVLVGAYLVWKKADNEVRAAEALTMVRPTTGAGRTNEIPADAYLQVAKQYPKTRAAARAVLLAAATMFAEGKYAEAKPLFDRVAREYPGFPFRGQALLGSAACLEAQGRLAEAANAYKELMQRHAADVVAPRAKLALARVYEAQNQSAAAARLYEELTRSEAHSGVGAEAEACLQEMRRLSPPTPAAASTSTAATAAPARTSPGGLTVTPLPPEPANAAVVQTNKP